MTYHRYDTTYDEVKCPVCGAPLIHQVSLALDKDGISEILYECPDCDYELEQLLKYEHIGEEPCSNCGRIEPIPTEDYRVGFSDNGDVVIVQADVKCMNCQTPSHVAYILNVVRRAHTYPDPPVATDIDVSELMFAGAYSGHCPGCGNLPDYEIYPMGDDVFIEFTCPICNIEWEDTFKYSNKRSLSLSCPTCSTSSLIYKEEIPTWDSVRDETDLIITLYLKCPKCKYEFTLTEDLIFIGRDLQQPPPVATDIDVKDLMFGASSSSDILCSNCGSQNNSHALTRLSDVDNTVGISVYCHNCGSRVFHLYQISRDVDMHCNICGSGDTDISTVEIDDDRELCKHGEDLYLRFSIKCANCGAVSLDSITATTTWCVTGKKGMRPEQDISTEQLMFSSDKGNKIMLARFNDDIIDISGWLTHVDMPVIENLIRTEWKSPSGIRALLYHVAVFEDSNTAHRLLESKKPVTMTVDESKLVHYLMAYRPILLDYLYGVGLLKNVFPPTATDTSYDELLFGAFSGRFQSSALSPAARSSLPRIGQSPRGKPHPPAYSALSPDTQSSLPRVRQSPRGKPHPPEYSALSPAARSSLPRVGQSPRGKPRPPSKSTGKTTPPQNCSALGKFCHPVNFSAEDVETLVRIHDTIKDTYYTSRFVRWDKVASMMWEALEHIEDPELKQKIYNWLRAADEKGGPYLAPTKVDAAVGTLHNHLIDKGAMKERPEVEYAAIGAAVEGLDIVERVINRYGIDNINLWNCHVTAWKVWDVIKDEYPDLRFVLGVADGVRFRWGDHDELIKDRGPITHCWLETDDLVIDTNPNQVWMWTSTYGTESGCPNIHVFPKSSIYYDDYFTSIDEAYKHFVDSRGGMADDVKQWADMNLGYRHEQTFMYGMSREYVDYETYLNMIKEGTVHIDPEFSIYEDGTITYAAPPGVHEYDCEGRYRVRESHYIPEIDYRSGYTFQTFDQPWQMGHYLWHQDVDLVEGRYVHIGPRSHTGKTYLNAITYYDLVFDVDCRDPDDKARMKEEVRNIVEGKLYLPVREKRRDSTLLDFAAKPEYTEIRPAYYYYYAYTDKSANDMNEHIKKCGRLPVYESIGDCVMNHYGWCHETISLPDDINTEGRHRLYIYKTKEPVTPEPTDIENSQIPDWVMSRPFEVAKICEVDITNIAIILFYIYVYGIGVDMVEPWRHSDSDDSFADLIRIMVSLRPGDKIPSGYLDMNMNKTILAPTIGATPSRHMVEVFSEAYSQAYEPNLPPVATDIDADKLLFGAKDKQNSGRVSYLMGLDYDMDSRRGEVETFFLDIWRTDECDESRLMDDWEMIQTWKFEIVNDEICVRYWAPNGHVTDIDLSSVPADIRMAYEELFPILERWHLHYEEPQSLKGCLYIQPPAATDIDVDELLFGALYDELEQIEKDRIGYIWERVVEMGFDEPYFDVGFDCQFDRIKPYVKGSYTNQLMLQIEAFIVAMSNSRYEDYMQLRDEHNIATAFEYLAARRYKNREDAKRILIAYLDVLIELLDGQSPPVATDISQEELMFSKK